MELPLWLKVAYTAFLAVLVPAYWRAYGPANFLWSCDVAVLGSGVALWLEDSLLSSVMLLGIAIPALAWNLDLLGRLVTGRHPIGMSGYMFDPALPRFLRSLSLFHVFLPVILMWAVDRLGYDSRAWLAQTGIMWVLLPVSYGVTRPADNVNWAFGPGARPQTRLPPRLYLALVMVAIPLALLPAHLGLSWLLGRR